MGDKGIPRNTISFDWSVLVTWTSDDPLPQLRSIGGQGDTPDAAMSQVRVQLMAERDQANAVLAAATNAVPA